MHLPNLGILTPLPALENLDLVGAPVASALRSWQSGTSVGVVEIDPDLADTAAMTEAYSVSLEASANCVVVSGRRGGEERIAACVVRADTRADVNNRVRRLLDVRKASFLPVDRAVEDLDIPLAVIGSGVRGSKLVLPGSELARLPAAEVVQDLAIPG